MKFRILIVDDDALIVLAMKMLLEERGYLVDTASNGRDGVDLVKGNSNGYALVILDYQMQGMDGKSTIQALHEVSPHLLVLVHSGDSSPEAVHLTRQAGAVGFLEKGSPAETLLDTVANWCRKYGGT